ncbi:MAG: hypothetical protein HQ567_31105 [Candidatus Nealsonbacteria bacterium]|nr:hypothetical protein [Candidatus Nealsonbacteria bacterium]
MTTIIRATDANRNMPGTVFNFADITDQAQVYLDEVRTKAVEIVTKAQADAAAVRQAAVEEGQRAGLEQIEQIVRGELSGIIEEIKHAKQAWITQWEASAVHVAAAIARRLIRRELSRQPEIALTLIREALELAAGSSHLRLHLNPTDLEQIGEHVEVLIGQLSSLATAEIVADPEITPGGCRVETQFGTIDQQFEAQLDRIEEELTQ